MMGLAKMKQTTQMEMIYRTSGTSCGSSPSRTLFMVVMFMKNAVNYGPNRRLTVVDNEAKELLLIKCKSGL